MRNEIPPYSYAFSCVAPMPEPPKEGDKLGELLSAFEPLDMREGSVAPRARLWFTPKLGLGQYVPPLVRVVAIELRPGRGSRPTSRGYRARLVCREIATSQHTLDSACHRFGCVILPVGWQVLWNELRFTVANEGDVSDVATINVYARAARGAR